MCGPPWMQLLEVVTLPTGADDCTAEDLQATDRTSWAQEILEIYLRHWKTKRGHFCEFANPGSSYDWLEMI